MSREAELEELLIEAHNTISFMHGCLTEPDVYAYHFPQHTERTIQRIRDVVRIPKYCVHSFHVAGCEACDERVVRLSAKAALAAEQQCTCGIPDTPNELGPRDPNCVVHRSY